MGFGINNVQTLINLSRNFPKHFDSKTKVLEFGDQKIYVSKDILTSLITANFESKNSQPYESKLI
jgi:hypothetical protein